MLHKIEGDEMEYHIAICDDDKVINAELESKIMRFGQQTSNICEVGCYYSGESLLKDMDKGISYDLIFLDIELTQANGITVGKYIREERKDNITRIVYISSKENYAMELFQVRPLDFMIKPVRYEKIYKVLFEDIERMHEMEQKFIFKSGYDQIQLPIREIIYFESAAHAVRIVTLQNTYIYYGTITEIEEQLANPELIRCHKSFLINYNQVTRFEYESVIMVNGERIMISQSKRKDVRQIILNHKRGKHR